MLGLSSNGMWLDAAVGRRLDRERYADQVGRWQIERSARARARPAIRPTARRSAIVSRLSARPS